METQVSNPDIDNERENTIDNNTKDKEKKNSSIGEKIFFFFFKIFLLN